jgi:anti-sigma regulatory factor (Ser/Thr protein kinase)
MSQFTVTLPNEPPSVPRARRELDRLASQVDDLTLRNTRLLVSELVTNAVRHASATEDSDITLTVTFDDGFLRVEVRDRGAGFEPQPRVDGQDVGSGWGLHLLERLAERWGVEREDGAKVWFELATDGAASG